MNGQCPCCGSEQLGTLEPGPSLLRFDGDSIEIDYGLAACLVCGTAFIVEPPMSGSE